MNKALESKPVNIGFFVANALIVAFCIVVFVGVTDEWAQTKADFERVNAVGSEPAPCRLPTPDIAQLQRMLGQTDTNPTGVVDYGTKTAIVNSAMCTANTVSKSDGGRCDPTAPSADDEPCANEIIFSSFSEIVKNASMSYAPDATDGLLYSDAEVDFRDYLCYKNARSGYNQQLFGDPHERVGRAYIHAGPAFVRLGTDNGNCWKSTARSPFREDDVDCTHRHLIRKQLELAEHDAAFAGGKAGELPKTHVMLYRLYALAVLSYWDRQFNGGKCFNQGSPRVSAAEWCDAIFAEFDEYGTRDGLLLGTQRSWAVSKAADGLRGRRCDVSEFEDDGFPPPPPPGYMYSTFPSVGFHLDGTTPIKNATTAACAHSMSYGLLDQQRLLGIPDPDEPFLFNSLSGSPAWEWGASLLYNAFYRSALYKADDSPKRWSIADVDTEHAFSKLKLYMAYRVAATGFFACLALAVVCYFGASAAWPLAAVAWQRLLNQTGPNGPSQIQRDAAGPIFYVATAVALFCFFWVVWVDPSQKAPYPVSDRCTNLGEMGPGAYLTTWARRDASWLGGWILAIPVISIVHLLVFSAREGCCANVLSRMRSQRRFQFTSKPTTVLIIMVLFAVAFVVLQLVLVFNTGAKYLALGPEQRPYSRIGRSWAEVLCKDVDTLVYGIAIFSLSVGTLSSMVEIEKQTTFFKVIWFVGLVAGMWGPYILMATSEAAARSAEAGDEYERYVAANKNTERGSLSTILLAGALLLTAAGFWVLTNLVNAVPSGNGGGKPKNVAEVKARGTADDVLDDVVRSLSANPTGTPRRGTDASVEAQPFLRNGPGTLPLVVMKPSNL